MRLLMMAATVLASASAAFGQYTIQLLPTPVGTQSIARGIDNGQVIGVLGSAPSTGINGVWSTPVSTFMDLLPPGYIHAEQLMCRAGEQVGFVQDGSFTQHGARWHGTVGTFQLIDAVGYASTALTCTDGVRQGGQVTTLTSEGHAAYFVGTSASVVDLHPAGYLSSSLYGIAGSQEVGYGTRPDYSSAALLWMGTPLSVVDLTPSGYYGAVCRGTDGAQQVGWALTSDTFLNHPAVWSGTSASFVDLMVPGYSFGFAQAVRNGTQVGYMYESDFSTVHAFAWQGTPESAVDLNQFLPAGYTQAAAYDIDSNGTISGVIVNSSGNLQAALWVPSGPPYQTDGFLGFTDGMTTKRNSVLHLKFELFDDSGNRVENETGQVSLARIGNPDQPVDPSLFASWPWGTTVTQNGNSKFYSYNLSTKNLLAGTYRITVLLSNGQKITGTFTVE